MGWIDSCIQLSYKFIWNVSLANLSSVSLSLTAFVNSVSITALKEMSVLGFSRP